MTIEIEKFKEYIKNSIDESISGNISDNTKEGIKETISSEFKKSIFEELEGYLQNILGDAVTEKLMESFHNNICILKDAIAMLDKTYPLSLMVDIDKINLEKKEILKDLMEVNNHYKLVYLDRFLNEKEDISKDPRKAISRIAREILGKLEDETISLIDEGICIEDLPSKKKVQDEFFDREEWDNRDISDIEIEYEGELCNLGREIEFLKESAGFSKKAFNFISKAGEYFSFKLVDLRDHILINEYALAMFNNSVDKLKKESLFKGEVEYILHGDPLEGINILKTKGQILLIRFAFNTFNIAMDPGKKQEAYALASAIAGWWTGGMGIPIVANLVMCAWGMGEALEDLKGLVNGKAIPLYKTKNVKISDEIPKLTYRDYLKIFLLLKSKESIVGRIQDLVEINIKRMRPNFKMGETYTAIRIEAKISIRYLFLSKAFIPTKIKNNDGRYVFHVVSYEEY
jgi:hypothetical protein